MTVHAALAAYYLALDLWLDAAVIDPACATPRALDLLAARRQRLDAARGALFAAMEAPL